MKKILLIISLFSLNIAAEQNNSVNEVEDQKKASKEENVQKLLEMMFNKEQVTNLSKAMYQQCFRSLTPQDQKDTPALEMIIERMTEKLSSKETIKDCTEIYSKHFNDDEIESILKFYESSAGQKVLKVMPQVASECGQVGMRVAQEAIMECMPQDNNNENACAVAK